ncbi:MAG: hypothetical protein NZ772_17175, partial [Cyanobacteria bacterium]|nr:hypothetical protein [Cyanobacteriota bacterium]MDW8203037.1 hypothetical protein [Cyanobacteriota bacterium SKYGB_h_bin112]
MNCYFIDPLFSHQFSVFISIQELSMQADLAALQISPSELERLAGLEINDLFIGGLIGGTVRSSVLRYPQRLLAFGLTELAIIILVLVVTLPIGLLMIRGVTDAIQDAATVTQVLQVMLGV